MQIIKHLLDKFQAVFGNPTRVCSTRMVNDRFFECKVRNPNPEYCEHSLGSGGGFICNHQDREIFSRK